MRAQPDLHFLEDHWDQEIANINGPELLWYRSSLLGADLQITNFGGGNTSSTLEQVDPLDRKSKEILWVKGSGGNLGRIKRMGFATLYLDKLLALVPWQRPGFELGMMLKKILEDGPGCDGVGLGVHGLFTWSNTQRASYLNTITIDGYA
jgi:rhamnose utilization protein RhaD (predicted bifunctional aldolase and dehydrogenase)